MRKKKIKEKKQTLQECLNREGTPQKMFPVNLQL